jgi:N-acetylmuramoyl-L-alanine amidase
MRVLARYLIVSAIASAAFAAAVEIRAQGAAPAQAAPAAAVAVTPTTPSTEAIFADAVAKEAAVRKALATRNPADTLLKAVRTVVDDYESFARHYPSSTQADDAFWRGGKLAADAFAEFHDAQEQATAVRLFRALAAQYPSSRLARQTSAQLSALKATPVAQSSPAASPAATPAPPAATPAPRAAAASPLPRTPARATHVPKPIPQPSTPPPAASTAGIATIKDIRRATMQDIVRVVIELDREVIFHDEHLENPSRVFVDLPATQASAPLKDQTLRFDADGDLVHQVRIGRHPGSTTRVVLDTEGVSSYSVYPLYSPYRLVIDCLRPSTEPAAEANPARAVTPPAPRLLSIRHSTDVWTPALPTLAAAATGALAEARVVEPPPVKVEPPARLPSTPVTPTAGVAPATSSKLEASVPPSTSSTQPDVAAAEPSHNLTGGYSLSRQLGLSVSRIVIDPGHGGHDPGAKGGGTTEAELVLDVSLRLAQLLQKVPGLEVVLTRKTDDYVSLQERTAIANRESADLFLSIHANANNSPQAQGVETYFLNFANTLSAAAVAARENAASGQNMGELPDVVKTIALNNKLDESRDFAIYVQREMVTKLRPANKTIRDLGVKQAPFVVLIGAAMPSVLAEVSFMTNPQEARLLKSSAYRQRIADALFEAVRTYQLSLKKVPTVAQQSR